MIVLCSLFTCFGLSMFFLFFLKNIIYLDASGLSCRMWNLPCSMPDLFLFVSAHRLLSSCVLRAPEHAGSVVAAYGLSCPTACGSTVKNLPANAGDTGDAVSMLGSGRSPGGGNGNPLQYSCLDNSMDRGAWQSIVHRVTRIGHNWACRPHVESQFPDQGSNQHRLCW